ncbi:hypothetical protein [Actinoplanes sp. NBRC 101535]|uniref:hypothetical protein n=1 Tax=Actinoplanes sp. NBRC 101535 TaxID=3032196 RepID=UPI0024A2ABE7|nr:hypothetical protein [Actinoplanes sp. NBRC 101535]GLY08203.1 hypothetical protein Acsp01_85820 [Actinoplanes sp. NBRC 101535]
MTGPGEHQEPRALDTLPPALLPIAARGLMTIHDRGQPCDTGCPADRTCPAYLWALHELSPSDGDTDPPG